MSQILNQFLEALDPEYSIQQLSFPLSFFHHHEPNSKRADEKGKPGGSGKGPGAA